MHELSIATSVLSIVEQAVPRDRPGYVTTLRLCVGELSGIDPGSLEFALSIIRNDTILHNAAIEIEVEAGEAECCDCRSVFMMPRYGIPCPGCGSYSSTVLKGKKMEVRTIIFEEGENSDPCITG